MNRLLAVCLLLCVLPLSKTTAEALPLTEPEDRPEQTQPSGGEAGLIDPNWVLAPKAEETAAAFAPDGLPQKHCGMRPLSPYAQVYAPADEDLLLAARVAFLEAGGKEAAYRAVLCVIYNRCMATRFGGKVTKISTEVYRKHQFSVIHNKRFNKLEPPQAIVDAARDIFVYGNLDLPENVLFFCAQRIGKHFGGHKFYKNIGDNLFFYGKTD